MLRSLAFLGMDEAVIDMVVDQRTLRAGDRVLDRLELLGDIDAGAFRLDHLDDAAQVTARPVQAFDDRGVAGVCIVRHRPFLPRPAASVESG